MLRLLWIAVPFAVSACGFHLRGALPLPDELKSMNLVCPSAKERTFCQALERQLAGNGIQTDTTEANFVLTIHNVETDRRALSINERSVATEIQLSLNADFSLTDSSGITIMPNTLIAASQSYRNDQNQVLGKGREEQQIKRELSQQLATQILSRLAPLSAQRIEAIRAAQAKSEQGSLNSPQAAPAP